MGNSNKPRPIPGRPVPGPAPAAPCGQYAQPNPYAAAQHYGGCPVNINILYSE